jgi:hypothetical protein
MPLTELMSQVQELSKIDKLRLMQFLATELVKEEDATNFFVADREYPVWSPYNCSEAANVLMNLLATKQQEQKQQEQSQEPNSKEIGLAREIK